MLQSGLSETIDDSEDIARFLTQSKHFNTIVVKPVAFLPNPKDQECSVSRHGSSPLESLWELGKGAAGDRTLYGAAIIKASVVRAVNGLRIEPAEPPERHAVIIGWYWSQTDPDVERAKQLQSAQALASKAEKVMK